MKYSWGCYRKSIGTIMRWEGNYGFGTRRKRAWSGLISVSGLNNEREQRLANLAAAEHGDVKWQAKLGRFGVKDVRGCVCAPGLCVNDLAVRRVSPLLRASWSAADNEAPPPTLRDSLGHSSSTVSLCRYFRQRACLGDPTHVPSHKTRPEIGSAATRVFRQLNGPSKSNPNEKRFSISGPAHFITSSRLWQAPPPDRILQKSIDCFRIVSNCSVDFMPRQVPLFPLCCFLRSLLWLSFGSLKIVVPRRWC